MAQRLKERIGKWFDMVPTPEPEPLLPIEYKSDTNIFVEEFLYRGRAKEENLHPAWHVVLASAERDAFGKLTMHRQGPMNIKQAKTNGFDLPKILENINTEIAQSHETKISELATANETVEGTIAANKQLTQLLATASKQLDELGLKHQSVVSELEELKRLQQENEHE